MAAVLKVGDTVMWRGGFGMDPPKPAKVLAIERTRQRRTKYGWNVDEIDWADKDYALVTLDTGNWAYGEQISPLPAGYVHSDNAPTTNLGVAW